MPQSIVHIFTSPLSDLRTTTRSYRVTGLLLILVFFVAGCTGAAQKEGTGKLFGDLVIPFSNDSATESAEVGTAPFPVNGYLWEATYETLKSASFSIADPDQGLMQTDWIDLKPFEDHRYRILARITSLRLASPSLTVNLVHQKLTDGLWVSVSPNQSDDDLRNLIRRSILDKARQIFIAYRYAN